MGLMTCFRKDCDHILCDLYSSKHGYICYDCYNELLNTEMPIEDFMNSPKGSETNSLQKHRERVAAEFGGGYDHEES